MLKTILIEVERAAKAFNLGDIDTAALCCRKAVEGHTEMAPRQASPEPGATDTRSELMKAVAALENKDFSLAALCLEKAGRRLNGYLNSQLAEQFDRVVQGLREENFTSVATALRDAVSSVVGPRPIEPIQLHYPGERM